MSPMFTEFGPYSYPEYDTSGISAWSTSSNPFTGTTGNSVNTQNFESKLNNTAVVDTTGTIDTPMYLANQGAYSTWWYQNNVNITQYYSMLYNLVNTNLGGNVVDTYAFQAMKTNYFTDISTINSVFVSQNQISDPDVVDALWNDPYYGLSNSANYVRWGVLADIT